MHTCFVKPCLRDVQDGDQKGSMVFLTAAQRAAGYRKEMVNRSGKVQLSANDPMNHS